MTEDNIKSVIKDNIRAGTANAISSQEFCKELDASINLQELRGCIETITKSLTDQQNTIGVISSIHRQILDKKIWISLRQLLEIVKPEIQQNIINAIANPDISRQHIPCKARKKPIFNDTASESSSTSESGSGSESSYDNEDFTVDIVKVKKCN